MLTLIVLNINPLIFNYFYRACKARIFVKKKAVTRLNL